MLPKEVSKRIWKAAREVSKGMETADWKPRKERKKAPLEAKQRSRCVSVTGGLSVAVISKP
jgi:hypothetical protein